MTKRAGSWGRVYWCERLMETQTALQVQKNIQDVTGLPCPCMRGLVCPLAPAVNGARKVVG